jgi:hypothetical protein
VGTHAAKVLAALLQCGVKDVRQAATQELQLVVPGSLEEWAGRLAGSRVCSQSKKRNRLLDGRT